MTGVPYAAFNYFLRPVGRYTHLEIADHCKGLAMTQKQDANGDFVECNSLGKGRMVVQQMPTGSPLFTPLNDTNLPRVAVT